MLSWDLVLLVKATCNHGYKNFSGAIMNLGGYVIFLNGLSGAGKTTLSASLVEQLEQNNQTVTRIDGDVLRGMLSSDLGFSRRDRELNLKRASYVAGEVVKHGGTVVCAMIAPYQQARDQAKAHVESCGGRFVEVYLSTPLEVCESRDPKGMYAQARQGVIQGFTGIDSPFEVPSAPDITLNTVDATPAQSLQQLWLELEKMSSQSNVACIQKVLK